MMRNDSGYEYKGKPIWVEHTGGGIFVAMVDFGRTYAITDNFDGGALGKYRWVGKKWDWADMCYTEDSIYYVEPDEMNDEQRELYKALKKALERY